MSTWTAISDARIDAESPIDEDLVTDIRENAEYLHERAVRAGTHGTGVRLAIARGKVYDTAATDGSGNMSSIALAPVTFSTDALDGNPNFSSAPVVVISIEESSTDDEWTTSYSVQCNIREASVATTGFTAEWFVTGATATATIGAYIHWIAIGPVTAGE